MDLDNIEKIKKLAIIALISDDYLMHRLVLKGGNAIDLIYKISLRASWDYDFSMEGEFKKEEMEGIDKRIRSTLQTTFLENGFHVFDIKFCEKPKDISPELADFWGGYAIEFKLVGESLFEKYKGDIEKLRRNALIITSGQTSKFEIEISKHEYCEAKQKKELDFYSIYVYSPAMIVIEKLRAICQQMPDYLKIVNKTHGASRAKDFFDIYTMLEHFDINLSTAENQRILENMFEVKKVPLNLLNKIVDFREYHRLGFESVINTVPAGKELKEFDFYYDYVVKIISTIKIL